MHLPVLNTSLVPEASSPPRVGDSHASAGRGGLDAKDLPQGQELVTWALKKFGGMKLIVTTGFGMEGCVLIDMISKGLEAGKTFTIYYLDTHFLFEETHVLRRRLEGKYKNLKFVNAGTTLTPEEQANRFGAELWKSDPNACCNLRKVVPLKALMSGAHAWITALRRSQSVARANIQLAEWDWKYELVKVNPLAYWSREQVWGYVQEHDVPYNPMHERGYPSIGCTNCTKMVEGASVLDYSRAGRWAGTGKTECGLHYSPEEHVSPEEHTSTDALLEKLTKEDAQQKQTEARG